MAFKTQKPDYSDTDNRDKKLSKLINYTNNITDELEFMLDSLSNSIKQIKKVISSDKSN